MKKISVLGMGYIGLPTACMLANNGFSVLGVDIDEEIIGKLNSGRLHIEEPDLEKIFLRAFKSKKLRVSRDLEKSDIFIISVPTPLNNKNRADLSYVISAADMIKGYIERGNLVILESTVPPGTTRNVVANIITSGTGLLPGKDFYLSFCPERVLPGRIVYELVNNDRIIGGFDSESSRAAEEVYMSFVRGKIYLTGLETSEFVKLAENTFRDINISFANELSLICKDYNINIWEAIRLANMHPRVNILNPGPGVGGHCIPVDPWFILENTGRRDTLIEKARRTNKSMPLEIASRIINIVGSYKNPKVTILGFSYKENVGDFRESPAIDIYNELIKNKIIVSIHDPLVSSKKYALSGLQESVKGSDLILLFSAHDVFRKFDMQQIHDRMRNKNIFDTRNFFNREEIGKIGFNYFSI